VQVLARQREIGRIYDILAKLGSVYFVFVSTFYATREALGTTYKQPSLKSFCDALIWEQDNLVQLGLISTVGTSNKALVVQQKDKSKNLKKQHPCHNNKQNKGLKPSLPTSTPNGDKREKSKNKKTDKHCNFCGKDGHLESKCFTKMESLEVEMKKHNISTDSSSSKSSSHVHFLLLVSPSMQLLILLMSGLLIMEHLIICIWIKLFFMLLMNVTPRNYLLVMIYFLQL
jgi:hypothetical protein